MGLSGWVSRGMILTVDQLYFPKKGQTRRSNVYCMARSQIHRCMCIYVVCSMGTSLKHISEIVTHASHLSRDHTAFITWLKRLSRSARAGNRTGDHAPAPGSVRPPPSSLLFETPRGSLLTTQLTGPSLLVAPPLVLSACVAMKSLMAFST